MEYDIAIMVDTGKNIGFGHIVRCMNLAKECIKYYNIIFIISTEESEEKVKSGEFDYVCIKNQQQVKEIIYQYSIKLILIDLIDINHTLIQEISNICKVGIIEDLYSRRYDNINLLINYNIYAGATRCNVKSIA